MPRKAKENEELKDKKITTKKSTTVKKSTTLKKKSANRNTVKKSTTKKISVSNNKEAVPTTVEYYDLPKKYDKTVVKVLSQTPKTLFIYWEISDDDINKYKSQFGENFFETTKPVLIIYNDTLNYSFEVEINDFANSWYLHVNDSNSDYRVELGRRPIINNDLKNNYVFITSSNEIESPNDHILFNNSQKMIYYRNVKTNVETSTSISSLSFMQNMGKIYDIYDLYKEFYKNEDNLENLSNPSSHM